MFWRKKRSAADFDEEIRSHLEHEADDLQQHSDARVDAEATARRAFGNRTAVQERFYEQGRWLLWDQISRDVRHALRLFWRRPGFSPWWS